MNELTKVLVLCDENPPVFECQLHHFAVCRPRGHVANGNHIVAGSAKRLYHREVAALVHDEANHVTLAASPLPEE